MEVTTVSPSPASPIEGDDLCETDVTDVAIHSAAVIIGLCGLAGNGAVIGLLNLENYNSGIFKLPVADFLFLLLTVPTALLFLVEDMSCSIILPLLYLSFLFHLSVVSYSWVLFRLMRSSPVLFVCKLCCRRGLPECLQLLVFSVQYWAFFALFTVIPAVTLLCLSHEQEHCRATLISMYTVILLLFVAPLLIFGTTNFIKAKWGSQQQQPQPETQHRYLHHCTLHSRPQPLPFPAAAGLRHCVLPLFFPAHLHQQQHQTLHLLLGW